MAKVNVKIPDKTAMLKVRQQIKPTISSLAELTAATQTAKMKMKINVGKGLGEWSEEVVDF